MSMINVAVVATVASAGASAYSAHQSNKNAKSVRNASNKALQYAQQNPSAFGEKIDFEPVEYNPIYKSDPGYANIAGQTIAGNQRNLPANINLMQGTNAAITQDSLTRLNSLYPQFQGQFNQQSRNTSNLLAGNIPYEDQRAITSKRTEAQSLGGGGANQQQVAADLGLTRMQLMESGAANLTNNLNLWNAIDPITRRVTPQSMFVDPQQAINSSIQENQFSANFEQQERDAAINYAMNPDPQKAGMLNLLSGQAGVMAATPMRSVAGDAISSGLQTAAGAYGNYAAAKQWGQPLQSQPGYVGTGYGASQASPYITGQGNRGYDLFFGPPTAPTNPNTGAQYAAAGSFGSNFQGGNQGFSMWR